jgi:hypothetical protein
MIALIFNDCLWLLAARHRVRSNGNER